MLLFVDLLVIQAPSLCSISVVARRAIEENNHASSRAGGGTEVRPTAAASRKGRGSSGGAARRARTEVGASFHGPGSAEQRHQLLRQRPRTQPDLLAGFREQGLQRGAGTDAAAVPWAGGGGRTGRARRARCW
ncbi:hypothetical protein PR202_gb08653 [Eleusine coracana subsp. coracana]|uniref:Uncharacterized protein n=1 Tax=Eleusine coracana subsp. coracana TaxID=191504 RepID=A0AAV5EGA6_ELECO|nr:hypothetical protein PR202_gb08653 [Eleusine coracana subsp. coracana]